MHHWETCNRLGADHQGENLVYWLGEKELDGTYQIIPHSYLIKILINCLEPIVAIKSLVNCLLSLNLAH